MSNRKILFISHDASRSGAPLTLLALIKAIKANHPEIEAHLLLLDKGVLYDDFCRYTSVIQLHKKKNIFLRIKRLFFNVPYKDDYKHLKLYCPLENLCPW